MRSYGLFFLLVGLLFLSCEKHEEIQDFEPPMIKIVDYEVLSDSSFNVRIRISEGRNAEICQLQVLTYDLANPDSEFFITNVELPNFEMPESEILQDVVVPNVGHDYSVYAQLKTKKNFFLSNPVTILFTNYEGLVHFYGSPYMSIDAYAPFVGDDIGRCLNPGNTFMFYINNSAVDLITEVLVGDKSVDFEKQSGSVIVRLPESMDAGIYEVTVCLGSKKKTLKVKQKIFIFPWKFSVEEGPNLSFGGLYYCNFQIGDYVYHVDKVNTKYNIRTRQVEEFSKLLGYPSPVVPTNTLSTKASAATSCCGCGYVIGQNSALGTNSATTKSALMRYDVATDQWTNLGPSPLPLRGGGWIFFSIDKYLYVGGGLDWSSDEKVPIRGFWRYDTSTEDWEQMSDLPFEVYRPVGECSDEDCAYVLLNKGVLWKFHADTESWTQEERHVLEYNNDEPDAAMICHNGKLIVVGGVHDSSVCLYDPEARTWRLMGSYNHSVYRPFGELHPAIYMLDGKLYVGPQFVGAYVMSVETFVFEMQ